VFADVLYNESNTTQFFILDSSSPLLDFSTKTYNLSLADDGIRDENNSKILKYNYTPISLLGVSDINVTNEGTTQSLKDGNLTGGFIPDNSTPYYDDENNTYYGVISSVSGNKWLDRNMGAKNTCTSITDTECLGDYYQWGRTNDGHEKVSSLTSQNQIAWDNNTTDMFINSTNLDWATGDDNGSLREAFWSRSDGTGFCPSGFKIPSFDDWNNENIQNDIDAFNKLKIPTGGKRNPFSGTLESNGLAGWYWSSSVDSTFTDESIFIAYDSTRFNSERAYRQYAMQVRCIKIK
jgi:hypothetical protein